MFKRSQIEKLALTSEEPVIGINLLNEIIIINEAAAQFFKVVREEAMGKDIWQVVPTSFLPQIRDSQAIELNRLHRVGEKLIIVSLMPFEDELGRVVGAVAFLRDMTEFQILSAQVTSLQEVRTLLTAIINSTQDAIQVVDENGLLIMVNPAYTRLIGLTSGDVLGKPPTVDIAEGESVHLQVLRTGQPVKGVSLKLGPKRKEVLVDVAPVIVEGKLRGTVGVLHDVSEIRRLSSELERAKSLIRHLEAKYNFEDILGKSEAIKIAIEQAQRAALTPATVMLRGESGTGKELFAHAIHRLSDREKGQFIRVNCAAIADSLLESELFGYVEGAFTGAKRGGKAGLFEVAHGGTIFLDEIGEVNLNLQAKLLRVLQEKEILRVGDNQPVPVDVRVISATNVNLEAELRSGKFREDLYYRLNVFPIFIPPLRQRLDDIPLLIHHMIRRFNQEYGRCVEKASEETLTILCRYDWPGNVRELENVVGRAIINMKVGETIIEAIHLPVLNVPFIHVNLNNTVKNEFLLSTGKLGEESFEELQTQWERSIFISALRKAEGNKTKAAQQLKMSIRNFYYKLEKHGLM